MPFTREEKILIDKMVNEIKKSRDLILELEDRLQIQEGIDHTHTRDFSRDFSEKEIRNTIAESVRRLIRSTNVPLHNHLDNQNGGSAFARRGASLVENIPVIAEEEA